MPVYYTAFVAGPHRDHMLPIEAPDEETAFGAAQTYGEVWFQTEDQDEAKYHAEVYGKPFVAPIYAEREVG